MGSAILFLLFSLIHLAIFIVIASAIVSWLVAFNVINTRNPTVFRVVRALDGITEPLLRPIRRFIPNLGGIDITPIILILLLQALEILIRNTIAGPLVAYTG